MGTASGLPDFGQLLERLKGLEDRISRIEQLLNREQSVLPAAEELPPPASAAQDDEELEYAIGQNWFAKAGIVFLALGIAFLLTFPYRNLPPALPSIVGYFLVGAILLLARHWRESARYLSGYLLGGGLALLFFSTLRLHMFSSDPPISSTVVTLSLLLIVVATDLTVALRSNSVYLVALSLSLGFLSTLLAAPHVMFGLILLVSIVTAVVGVQRRWYGLLLLGILLSYLTHFAWVLGNPLFTGKFEFAGGPDINLVFLLLYAVTFAVGVLYRPDELHEQTLAIFCTVFNALGCYVLYLLITFATSVKGAAEWHLLASVVFLALSVAFWIRLQSIYSTFIYAMLGYMALSTAIVIQFEVPGCFVWLSWQSILVISTAVWFRSRIIIVANFVIYLIVFFSYLVLSSGISVVSLSFGFVALLSARILNWQKERLTLKTEMMRNAYLASALFLFPYALYRSMPQGYVSLSWIVVALFYYGMSVYLKSRKYRWMALLTLILTIAYVFLVDLMQLEPLYRMISFIVLGVVLLGISLLYGRRRAATASQKPS